MAIDSSIYNALAAPQKSAFDYANEFEARNAQRSMQGMALQQNALQLKQAQQAATDDATYRDAARGFGTDATANYNALLGKGLPKQAMAYQKAALDNKKTASEIDESGAKTGNYKSEAAKRDFDVQQSKRMQHLQELVGVNDVQGAHQWLDAAAASGELPMDRVQQVKTQLAQNPASVQQWKQGAIAAGFTLQQQAENAFKAQQLAESERSNRETASNTRRGQDISASTTMRGQNMTDARSREKNQIDRDAVGKVEWKQDADGNFIALPKEVGRGPVTPVTVTGAGKREIQAGHALDVINEARGLLDQSTGSYAGAGIDQLARVAGISTQGAQTSAKLKALEGALMMAQPRMEGPQSDKDVSLYKQMAGQLGDPTVPAATKKAALDSIQALHSKYVKNGAAPAPAASPKTISFGDLK